MHLSVNHTGIDDDSAVVHQRQRFDIDTARVSIDADHADVRARRDRVTRWLERGSFLDFSARLIRDVVCHLCDRQRAFGRAAYLEQSSNQLNIVGSRL